jgi:hypothetical protein
MLKEKRPQDIDSNDAPYLFVDEATKERIKRHISDINDVISENDIKNAKIPWINETDSMPMSSK